MQLIVQEPDFASAAIALAAIRVCSDRFPEVYADAVRFKKPIEYLTSVAALSMCWPRLAQALNDSDFLSRTASDLERWHDRGFRWTVIGEPGYPALLAAAFDPPPILFYRGTLRPCTFSLAIVGSRSADAAGSGTAREIGRCLASRKVTVVSGLAHGVDTAAHRGSLLSGADFPTIAVLGTGLDRIYPHINSSLADEIIANGGLILSQFEPESRVFPSNFIARNRVIAALTRGVLVIQAAKKSGSLATARFALEEGRDVFVVPGLFGDPRFEGSHQLLRDGAILVTDSKDIYDCYPELAESSARPAIFEEKRSLDSPIISLLRERGSLTTADLASHLEIPPELLESELLELELAGTIDRLPGELIRLTHLN